MTTRTVPAMSEPKNIKTMKDSTRLFCGKEGLLFKSLRTFEHKESDILLKRGLENA